LIEIARANIFNSLFLTFGSYISHIMVSGVRSNFQNQQKSEGMTFSRVYSSKHCASWGVCNKSFKRDADTLKRKKFCCFCISATDFTKSAICVASVCPLKSMSGNISYIHHPDARMLY